MSLSLERLRAHLGPDGWAWQIEVHEVVGSTNDALRERAAAGAPAGTALLAGRQTAGRGRQGRVWDSPAGHGLYLSVLYRPRRPLDELGRFTLAGAVALAETARRFGCPAEIEWPNDVVCHGRKLGGVLAEMRSQDGRARELVLGCGMNVGQTERDFPPELVPLATSLRLIAGCAPQREAVAAAVLSILGPLGAAVERGDWPAVAARWSAVSPRALGRDVVVRQGGRAPFSGRTIALAADGALVVRATDGRETRVHLADAVRWGA